MLDGFLDLFEPVNAPDFSNAEGVARIADRIEAHRFDSRPMLEGARVALLGSTMAADLGITKDVQVAPDAIRHWLYQLSRPQGGSLPWIWETSGPEPQRRTHTQPCNLSSLNWSKWASSRSSSEAGTT